MAEAKNLRETHKRSQEVEEKQLPWAALKRFFSCKYHQTAVAVQTKKKLKKISCSVSLCKLRETSRVMQRPEMIFPDSYNASSRTFNGVGATHSSSSLLSISSASMTPSCSSFSSSSSSSFVSSVGGSFRGIHLRRLSGCYECHLVVDPANGVLRDPSLTTPTLFFCSECEEIFTKTDSLELHQSVRHAVSELAAEETSKKIVEIIFLSSWLKKKDPICKIERILKINNTKKTTTRFEEYRDSIISKAKKLSKKHPRCIADGNELLRFHCSKLNCSLGLNGSTNLCHSAPHCEVCSIILNGFRCDELGRIPTMATSGKAHDLASVEGKKAMLVCRVIGGRVRKSQETLDEWDSVAGAAGIYSSLDELFVLDSRAILPCFVVIYSCF